MPVEVALGELPDSRRVPCALPRAGTPASRTGAGVLLTEPLAGGFEQQDIENIFKVCTVTPHVNQLLVHAGNNPAELIAYCQNKDILVEAYSPIADGEILKNPDVAAMADRYGVTVPQLCIRYTLQLGTVSLPKTANPEHMRGNAQVDFSISDDDMAVLRSLQARDYGEHSGFPVYSGK